MAWLCVCLKTLSIVVCKSWNAKVTPRHSRTFIHQSVTPG